MSFIVKSTPEAIDSISRMRAVIDSGLVEQLRALDTEGVLLMEPNHWAGPKADQFRQLWPDTRGHLQAARQALVELNDQLRIVQQNIQTAGA